MENNQSSGKWSFISNGTNFIQIYRSESQVRRYRIWYEYCKPPDPRSSVNVKVDGKDFTLNFDNHIDVDGKDIIVNSYAANNVLHKGKYEAL